MRKYRTVFIEVPRKNGKTTLCAAIGIYMLFADRERGAEIYAAADPEFLMNESEKISKAFAA